MTTERRLDWASLRNARDLGGYPTADGGAIRWGALVRSDSLSSLTPTGSAALIAHGVRTVIDLRMPEEAESWPSPFAVPGDHGIAYHNLSFIDPATSLPAGVPSLAEDYQRMLGRFGAQVAAVVTVMARADEGGVLVHCAAGKDRTGLVVAMVLSALGVPPEVVAEDYALTAESLREGEERFIEHGPGTRAEREAVIERLRARPEVMLEVLAHVNDRHGGAAGYLLAAGVAEEDLDRLRARAVGTASD